MRSRQCLSTSLSPKLWTSLEQMPTRFLLKRRNRCVPILAPPSMHWSTASIYNCGRYSLQVEPRWCWPGAPPIGVDSFARYLGFDEVIDLSEEKLSDGVRRITKGYGADIVIDAVGGAILSEALSTLATGGSLTTLGYSAGRKTTIDVTDLIWKRASMKSFSLFEQPAEAWSAAWSVIIPLLQSGAVKPIVAKTFPLVEAAEALRYLVEGRPFGRVLLTV